MSSQRFVAEIDEWVAQEVARINAVVKASAQELMVRMQRPVAKGGLMRVDTGWLRNSFVVTLGAPGPSIDPKSRPPENAGRNRYQFNIQIPTATIASATLGTPISFRYTAAYALHRESKDGFVRLPAADWSNIVREQAAKLQMRVVG